MRQKVDPGEGRELQSHQLHQFRRKHAARNPKNDDCEEKNPPQKKS